MPDSMSFVPTEHADNIVYRYQSGQSVRSVCEATGYTQHMVIAVLVKSNAYKPRARRPISDPRKRAAIVAEHQSGVPIRQIARKWKHNDALIKRVLDEEAVKRAAPAVPPPDEADEDDAAPVPPAWAVSIYRRRVAQGMPEPVARRMSNLAHYDASQIAAAMARTPEVM